MRFFLGKKLIKEYKENILEYYILQHHDQYGIQIDLKGDKYSSTCVYNISKDKSKVEKVARMMLKNLVQPAVAVDVLDDFVK